MNLIEVFFDVDTKLIEEDIISFVNEVLYELKIDGWQFSITFVDLIKIEELNTEFRNKKKPTDVITFNLSEDEEISFPDFIDEDDSLLFIPGDSVICLDIVKLNAHENSVNATEELKRVIIHSILHLNNENHESYDFTIDPVLKKQEAILKKLTKNGDKEWDF